MMMHPRINPKNTGIQARSRLEKYNRIWFFTHGKNVTKDRPELFNFFFAFSRCHYRKIPNTDSMTGRGLPYYIRQYIFGSSTELELRIGKYPLLLVVREKFSRLPWYTPLWYHHFSKSQLNLLEGQPVAHVQIPSWRERLPPFSISSTRISFIV